MLSISVGMMAVSFRATTNAVHLGRHDGSQFQGDGLILVAATAASDNLGKFGGRINISHFAKYQHPAVSAAVVLGRRDALSDNTRSV